MKKIGIMGGTFDPIHSGHLMLGKQAYEEYDLDCVWYMPSRQPPHKKDRHITSPADRLEMVRLAVESTLPFLPVLTLSCAERRGIPILPIRCSC